MSMTLNETFTTTLGSITANSDPTNFKLKIQNFTENKIFLSKLINGKWIIGENIHPNEPISLNLGKNLSFRIHKNFDSIIAIYSPPQIIKQNDQLIMTISEDYQISIKNFNKKENEFRQILELIRENFQEKISNEDCGNFDDINQIFLDIANLRGR